MIFKVLELNGFINYFMVIGLNVTDRMNCLLQFSLAVLNYISV